VQALTAAEPAFLPGHWSSRGLGSCEIPNQAAAAWLLLKKKLEGIE
jgi:hypothetical protein